MLSWRLGNVRDITTSLALPDAYRSMAFAAPAFRLDDLPSEARDTVFAALLRRDAARASGVSKAWRDSLGAPHLWTLPTRRPLARAIALRPRLSGGRCRLPRCSAHAEPRAAR
jgi:hypothetical protein